LYYLRTRPAADPIKFTVDKTKLKSTASTKDMKEMNGSIEGIANGNHSNGYMNGKNGHNVESNSYGVNSDLDDKEISNVKLIEQLKLSCSKQNKENCLMCSS
jgi:hypothetical protein